MQRSSGSAFLWKDPTILRHFDFNGNVKRHHNELFRRTSALVLTSTPSSFVFLSCQTQKPFCFFQSACEQPFHTLCRRIPGKGKVCQMRGTVCQVCFMQFAFDSLLSPSPPQLSGPLSPPSSLRTSHLAARRVPS